MLRGRFESEKKQGVCSTIPEKHEETTGTQTECSHDLHYTVSVRRLINTHINTQSNGGDIVQYMLSAKEQRATRVHAQGQTQCRTKNIQV